MQEETEIAEEKEKDTEIESESIGGKVGVNVGKTARKIEAAKTKTQLRAVIAEISGDMQEVKANIFSSSGVASLSSTCPILF